MHNPAMIYGYARAAYLSPQPINLRSRRPDSLHSSGSFGALRDGGRCMLEGNRGAVREGGAQLQFPPKRLHIGSKRGELHITSPLQATDVLLGDLQSLGQLLLS